MTPVAPDVDLVLADLRALRHAGDVRGVTTSTSRAIDSQRMTTKPSSTTRRPRTSRVIAWRRTMTRTVIDDADDVEGHRLAANDDEIVIDDETVVEG
jgi:hypothetical protein